VIPPIESISFNIGKPKRKKRGELDFTVKNQGEEVWCYIAMDVKQVTLMRCLKTIENISLKYIVFIIKKLQKKKVKNNGWHCSWNSICSSKTL
jgi:hypothetical protein